MTDHSEVHPDSKHLAHLIDLFLFKGAPLNNDPEHKVKILVNHGYVVGFAPSRRQPLWSAYRVANATRWVDYDRPHLYYADERLDDTERLDNKTFGTHNGIKFNVGHMVPNEVINVQFGRLAQLETFFMSNMCPQYEDLNQGVWLKLENAIRNIEDRPGRDHVWAIVGPVFGESPSIIRRSDGNDVPVPEAFYCITIDPFDYPWDKPGNQAVACFLIPQSAPRRNSPTDYPSSIQAIEEKTKLTFMPGFDSMPGFAQQVTRRTRAAVTNDDSRILAQF